MASATHSNRFSQKAGPAQAPARRGPICELWCLNEEWKPESSTIPLRSKPHEHPDVHRSEAEAQRQDDHDVPPAQRARVDVEPAGAQPAFDSLAKHQVQRTESR